MALFHRITWGHSLELLGVVAGASSHHQQISSMIIGFTDPTTGLKHYTGLPLSSAVRGRAGGLGGETKVFRPQNI